MGPKSINPTIQEGIPESRVKLGYSSWFTTVNPRVPTKPPHIAPQKILVAIRFIHKGYPYRANTNADKGCTNCVPSAVPTGFAPAKVPSDSTFHLPFGKASFCAFVPPTKQTMYSR